MNKPHGRGKDAATRRKESDARKREQGLTRVSVWVPAKHKQALVEFAAKLCASK